MAVVTSFFLTICFGLVLALLAHHWRRRELYRLAANIPGPKGWPIIGNALIFFGVKSMEGVVQRIQQVAHEFSSGITKLWVCSRLVFVVSEPKYIEALLNHPSAINKDDLIYKQLAITTGEGIFTRNGKKWLRMRKEAVKLFNPKSIEAFEDIVSKRLQTLCGILDSKAGIKEEINIRVILTKT